MTAQQPDWWRTVLGEYATGVTIITGRDGDRDLGMAVGTFSAVSQDPPMVGFMLTEGSRTGRAILESGRFCANMLTAEHESVSRSFAGGPDERFTVGDWDSTGTGHRRLRSASAWIEADIASVTPAGDHVMVLGAMTDFGTANSTANRPLLYFRGGYGTFAPATMDFDPREFGRGLRQVEIFRHAIENLSERVGLATYIGAVTGDNVLVLAQSQLPRSDSDSLVGQSFPFAAPISPVLAAWAPADRRKIWEENARILLATVDRPHLRRIVEGVHTRGYAISVGDTMLDTFDSVVGDPDSGLHDMATLWGSLDRECRDDRVDCEPHLVTHALQAPIFGPQGTAEFELFVSGLTPPSTPERFAEVRDATVRTAHRLSEAIGGVVPADYPRPAGS